MKVTLRKASALQNSIQEIIRSIEINDVVKLNEYQDIGLMLATAAEEAQKNLSRVVTLTSTLYSIRNAVGAANAQSGVDEKLTNAACIEKLIQLWTSQSKRTVRTDMAVLTGRAEKLRKADNDRSLYYGSDQLVSGLATQADIDSAKVMLASLKRDKQKLQDEILELNVRTEVELSANVEAVLKTENLI